MNIDTLLITEHVHGIAIENDEGYIEVLYHTETGAERWDTKDDSIFGRTFDVAALKQNVSTTPNTVIKINEAAKAVAHLQD